MKRKKNTSPICPCCRKPVTAVEVSKVITITKNGPLFRSPPPGTRRASDEEIHGSLAGHDRWACDECLKAGRAIAGNPAQQRQVHPMHESHHYLAYFDRTVPTCRDCGTAFVYAKEAQRFYFEALAKDRSAKAVRCSPCRKARKKISVAHQELGEMLDQGKLIREEDREKVVAHYRLLGREDKARFYERGGG